MMQYINDTNWRYCTQPALASEIYHHPDMDKMPDIYSEINTVRPAARAFAPWQHVGIFGAQNAAQTSMS